MRLGWIMEICDALLNNNCQCEITRVALTSVLIFRGVSGADLRIDNALSEETVILIVYRIAVLVGHRF